MAKQEEDPYSKKQPICAKAELFVPAPPRPNAPPSPIGPGPPSVHTAAAVYMTSRLRKQEGGVRGHVAIGCGHGHGGGSTVTRSLPCDKQIHFTKERNHMSSTAVFAFHINI